MQTQPARLVDQVDRVRSLVAGERQHALVHRPERHLAALPRAAGVADPQPDACRVTRPVFGLERLNVDLQALDLRGHPQLGVADADRGSTRVRERARRRAAASCHDDRHERVRRVRLADWELEGRRPAGDVQPALLDQTFTLHRHPRFGVRQRRSEEHRRGVADAIALLVGNHLHLEAALVVPRHPILARDPTIEARGRGTPGRIGGGEGHDVAATCRRREPAWHRIRGTGEIAARHGVRDPVAHLLGQARPLPHHLMPLAADDCAVDRDARDSATVRAHRDDRYFLGAPGGPEVVLTERFGGQVECGRVYGNGGCTGYALPIDVGHGRLQSRAGRESFRRRGDGDAQREVAASVERIRAGRNHGHVRLRHALFPVLFPPPPGFADVVAVGAGDVKRPGADRLLPRHPAHGRAGHRRPKQIASLDRGPERVAREPRRRVGSDVHQELGRSVLGHAITRAVEVDPAPLAPEADRDLIVPERKARRQREGLLGRPEGRQSDRGVAQRSVFPVGEHPAQRVARRGRSERAERAVAHHGFGVNGFAGAVNAALGEHRARGGEALVAPSARDVEAPRGEVRVVSAHRNEGTVGPERGADIAVEPTVVATLLTSRGRVGLEPRQARQSPGISSRGGAWAAAAVVQGHPRSGSRTAVAHTRHPYDALFHAYAHVHAQVRDLHDGGRLALRPWLSARGVGPRARDADRRERRIAGSRGVVGGQADARHHRSVGLAFHCYFARRGAGCELRPQFLEVPPVRAQHHALEAVRYRCQGHDQRVHVDMAHGERAIPGALDEHPTISVLDRRAIARGHECGDGVASEALPEDVGKGAVHPHCVCGARFQGRFENPCRGLFRGIADRKRQRRLGADMPQDARPAYGRAELQLDRSSRTKSTRARETPGAQQPQRAVRLKVPPHEGARALRVQNRLSYQLARAGSGQECLGGERHDAPQAIGRPVPLVAARLLVFPGVLRGDGPLVHRLQANHTAPGARFVELEVGGRPEPVEVDGRAVHQLEPGRRCDECGMAVAAHGRAGEQARPANAERKAIRRFEPAAIHRGESVRDGDGVLDVRSEWSGGGEADRHRIPPLEPALHGGGDRQDRLRVNGSVERAGDRPVERHGDHARRCRLVSRRRAEDFQWLRTGRRVGRQEQRGGVQRTHDIARKEGR